MLPAPSAPSTPSASFATAPGAGSPSTPAFSTSSPARAPSAPLGLLAGALATLVLAPRASAQEALHETTGDIAWGGLGMSLAVAGDVDGDGVDDVWTGAPDPVGIAQGNGEVRLLSGLDGSVLERIGATEPLARFGMALAAGRDLDADGVPEVAIGAPQGRGRVSGAGTVYVRRLAGTRHALRAEAPLELLRLRGDAAGDRFGEALAFLDDRDGDGVAELLVGAPGDDVGGSQRGSVRIVSGRTGARIQVLRGLAGSEFGSAVADVGDLNGDGRDELLIGAPHGIGLVADAGHAVLLSGSTLLPLAVFQGAQGGGLFGLAVAPAGDVDGNGSTDLALGAPGANTVQVYSGTDGALLWSTTHSAYEPENWGPPGLLETGFGRALCAVGDQDGDGHDDLAVGSPEASSVHILSGVDGTIVRTLTAAHRVSSVAAPILGVTFGYALARVGDLNGDGRDDLVVGSPYDFHYYSGGTAEEDAVGSVGFVTADEDPGWLQDVSAISAAGDVDGDGSPDVAYGTPAGVVIRSGTDGEAVRVLLGIVGGALRPAGDVNHDGVEDLLVGNLAEAGNRGSVRVCSGADGSVLYTFLGDAAGDRLGTSVAGVGDLDHDGFADFAAGAPLSTHPSALGIECVVEAGYVRVWSGQTGALLLELTGEGLPGWDCGVSHNSEAFGFSLTGVGDWNLDGTPDVAVGVPGGGPMFGGAVRVFSGLDGALLQEFLGTRSGEFGIAVDGAPDFDLDDDGRVDLVVGEQIVAYGISSVTRGYAQVFSSATGARLAEFQGTLPAMGYGGSVGPAYSVAALADFDLDGHSDVGFGNPSAPGPLGPGVGEVRVFSGADGSVLELLQGTSSWDYLGYGVAPAGDTTGDGASDLLVLALPSFQPSVGPHARLVPGRVPGP